MVSDHPRMRGEHWRGFLVEPDTGGSSPHARGALDIELDMPVLVRIIPACAGSTYASSYQRHARRDHPRMRGEHILKIKTRTSIDGSSPHARGALGTRLSVRVFSGIIPACAGSTLADAAEELVDGDHPRMRGEHGPEFRRYGVVLGSSPHARGARPLVKGNCND